MKATLASQEFPARSLRYSGGNSGIRRSNARTPDTASWHKTHPGASCYGFGNKEHHSISPMRTSCVKRHTIEFSASVLISYHMVGSGPASATCAGRCNSAWNMGINDDDGKWASSRQRSFTRRKWTVFMCSWLLQSKTSSDTIRQNLTNQIHSMALWLASS